MKNKKIKHSIVVCVGGSNVICNFRSLTPSTLPDNS